MSDSPGVFIFTASNEAASENLEISFWNPVPSEIARTLRAQAGLTGEAPLYAWGATASPMNLTRWARIRPGDWMLCVAHKAYRGVTRIKATVRNAQVAESLWGVSGAGGTWELIVLFSQPRRIQVPIDSLATHLHRKYQGFTRLSEDRLESVERKFDSIDDFIDTSFPPAATREALSAEDVLAALQTYDQGAGANLGPAVLWELVYEGRAYPAKAIFALASARTRGRAPRASEVSSADLSECLQALRSLGFTLRKRG